MDHLRRIEAALEECVQQAAAAPCPPRLAEALRYAVFPGGGRLRPQLTLAVATACGDDEPALADAAACAIELLHCASLVHDDLPCFDDAALRRGRPSLHAAFGEEMAVLVGDALIVQAFASLGQAGGARPERLAPLLRALARGAGAPHGIVAGQAWEGEPVVELAAYHRSKTGALFAAAAAAGARAAGKEAGVWFEVGMRLGQAYQLADDLGDAAASAAALGKPVGQDELHGRPSAVAEYGLAGAATMLREQVEQALALVPPCTGRDGIRRWIRRAIERLGPVARGEALSAS